MRRLRRSAARRRTAAGTVAVVAAGALLTVPASPAHAHAALKSISPADGARVTTVPAEAVLTFNERVDGRFTTVRVTGPGGIVVSSGDDRVSGAVVTQPLLPLTRPGRYVVSFRTVSADGHPIEGRRGFELAPPGAAGPSGQARSTPVADAAAGGGGAGTDGASGDAAVPPGRETPSLRPPAGGPSRASLLLLGTAGAGLAAALVAALVLTARRTRAHREAETP